MSGTKAEWSVSDLSGATLVGTLEFQDLKGEWRTFEVMAKRERLIFGGSCAGFLESGFMERESGESLESGLEELQSDLEAYYNDGPQYVSRIVVNERM